MSDPTLAKGERAEELLRLYFLLSGYYVVRGARLAFDDDDVTDVDLWLYMRPSPLGRERINVDAKYKNKPKALERVLWAKGLQSVLGCDRSIVATTDKRPQVRRFAERHGVLVLDGHFLKRLEVSRTQGANARLDEEALDGILAKCGQNSSLVRRRVAYSKSRLLSQLSFDSCNRWLDDLKFLLELLPNAQASMGAQRALYVVASHFLIGLDFVLAQVAFEEPETRRSFLENGFRYGAGGRQRLDDSLKFAFGLLDAFAPGTGGAFSRARSSVTAELEALNVSVLADHFSRAEVSKELFSLARGLEALGYSEKFTPLSALPPNSIGLFGVLADHFDLDRIQVLGTPGGEDRGEGV
ncbi:MAG: hypothetical protein HUU55_18685 [Myxococcales bacterium]|nr:hypothetical protein [Myxococcales bacterium]